MLKKLLSTLVASCLLTVAPAMAAPTMHTGQHVTIKAKLHNGMNVVSQNGHKFNVTVKNHKIVKVTNAGAHGMMAASALKLTSSTHNGDICTECFVDDYGNVYCIQYIC